MYPYLLNTAHLIILFLFITPYWCFGFKTPLSNYKVEEGFQSIAIGNRHYSKYNWNGNVQNNSGVLLQQLAGNYASNNVPNSYATELKVGYMLQD
jgi:hypothetical protein